MSNRYGSYAMADSKFYCLLLTSFAALIIIVLVIVDSWQPKGINVELLRQVFFLITPIISALLLLIHSEAKARRVVMGQEELRTEVKAGREEAKSMRHEVQAVAAATGAHQKFDPKDFKP